MLFFAAITAQAQTVTFGKQVWMSENLNVDKFRNGAPIPQAKTDEEWEKAGNNKQPAWCYYNNDPKIGAKYGKLYNWYAVADARKLCPVGWHVSSDHEWAVLTDYLGGWYNAGSKMMSTSGLHDNGNKSSGFGGLPGGSRNYVGAFESFGYDGLWWCSTSVDAENAWYRYLNHELADTNRDGGAKEMGFSVRCIKD